MNNEILILELGDRYIKSCKAKLINKKYTIDSLEFQELPYSFTLLELEKYFSKFSKQECNNLILSFPRSSFLIRFLTLPSANIGEVREMLPFQLSKILPYPLEEVVYDFSLINPVKNELSNGAKKSQGSCEVVVFVAQKRKMRYVFDFLKRSSIVPLAVTISSWGLYNWLILQGVFLKTSKSPVLLIDIDKYLADVLIADKEGILFSRSFFYSKDSELTEGITQSLAAYLKRFSKSHFDKIFFAGIKKQLPLDKLKLNNAIFVESFQKSKVKEPKREEIANSGFSFASILGLADKKALSKFEFSDEHIKKKRRQKEKKDRYLEAAVIFLEVALIFSIFFFKNVFDKYVYMKSLDYKLSIIKVEAKELDKIADKIKVLDDEFKHSVLFTDMLYQILSAIPENTQLTLLDFHENREFSIKGYADDAARVFEILTFLNNSKLFNDVKVKYVSKVNQRNAIRAEFNIYGKF